MMRRDVVKPRIYPVLDENKQPVLLSMERIEEKRKEFGPYVFCFPPETPILMADWSEKKIIDIKPGEYVVGYAFPTGKCNKTKLVKSLVKSVGYRTSVIIEAKLESGRTVRCTPDHKWFTGRRGKDIGGVDEHKTYLPIITPSSKSRVRSLISVYDPREINKKYDAKTAGWLAGIFDGEGAVSGGCIHFHQSISHNPIVCEAIRCALRDLGFDYGEFVKNRGDNGPVADFYLRGGRQEKIRFLNLCRPARSQKIIDFLFEQGTRDFGKSNADKVVSIKELPERKVYNIETETGNYIAWGYATKNSSQMLQDPVADEAQNFKIEWIKTWDAQNTNNLQIYILVDPASKKKKHSDYTAMFVIGLGLDRNYYVIDMIRDRLNLTERMQVLFGLHEMYKPVAVGYEEYGMQSDIEHLQYVMEQKNYRFPIFPLGGNVGKEDRIRSLVPIFEQGRIYLPKMCIRTTHDKKTLDLTKVFIEEEYKTFPVGAHDDMLDALARILDHGKKGLFATFPTEPIKFEKRIIPSINKIADMEREKIFEDVIKAEEWEKELYDY
jgi:predicted phage terminase large subunit-like protein